VDVSDIYEPQWSQVYLNVVRDANRQKTEVQFIDVGSTHTTCGLSNGKVYTWGWNDYN
jgi:alpha-tubulin suppressor-like RCC1 family protein